MTIWDETGLAFTDTRKNSNVHQAVIQFTFAQVNKVLLFCFIFIILFGTETDEKRSCLVEGQK